MYTRPYAPKATAVLATASFIMTLAATSIAFGKMIIPGTPLPNGQVATGGGPGGPAEEPDDAFSKPRKPGPLVLVSRTDNSIRFQWTDKSSYETGYELYRGSSFGGPWTLIASWGLMPGVSGTMEYTDYGRSRDTQYWYKVIARNFHGESTPAIQTFATLDGRNVSRLRLVLRTANVSDADTDDDVNVSLRDYDNGGTWLDYGRDDFERGDEFTYELSLEDLFDGIQDLSEINHIYLLKPGSDGWCIESLTLVAETLNGVDNGVEIFTQDFGTTSSTCRWLDGQQNYLVIGRDTLRAHPLWQVYQQPDPPLALLSTDLERRIEGTVGDTIHDGAYVDAFPVYMGTLDVSWTDDALHGESHVKVSKKDTQAVHVEFNLDVDTPASGGLTGGLSFDLRFAGVCRTEKTVCGGLAQRKRGDLQLPADCHTETTPAKIEMTTENIDATADFDWITEAMTLWLINFLEDNIADRITASFPDFSQTITVDNEMVSCVTPDVASDGTVVFNPTFEKRTGPLGLKTVGTVGGTMTKTATK